MSYEIYKVKKVVEAVSAQIINTNISSSDNDVYFERISKINQINSINWNDDIDNIFISFDFETTEELKVGEWVELYEKNDEKTIFYGIITTSTRNNKNMYKYSGYDTGFFLLKNKISIQFRDIEIFSAIISVCNKINILCGSIPPIEYKVKKIYKNKTAEEILKELLKEAEKQGLKTKLYYDCYDGKLNLFEEEINNELKGYIANIYKINSFDSISSFEISSAINEMKNQILVVSSEAKSIKDIKKTIKDENSIKKYGLLQEIVETKKDETDYNEIAERNLKEKNKIEETLNLTVLGDYNVRKGIITIIKNDRLGIIENNYKIERSSHSIVGTKETVTIKISKD